MQRQNRKPLGQRGVVVVLCIMLCCAALLGTTYAWLEDRVSHQVAMLQVGTTEVDLIDADGNSFIVKNGASQSESDIPMKFSTVTENDGEQVAAEDNAGWKKGEVYQLPVMYVVNRGTTELVYTVSIEGITDVALEDDINVNLTDFIEFTIRINNNEVIGTSAVGLLAVVENSEAADENDGKDTLVILGKLKDDVDLSNYQGMTFTGITIRIDAEQKLQ